MTVTYSELLIHACFSWGRNQNGQLGLGTTEDSLLPQTIQAFEVQYSSYVLFLDSKCKYMIQGKENLVSSSLIFVRDNNLLIAFCYGRDPLLGKRAM